MYQIFKRLIVSSIIPLFGGSPISESAQVVITVREKTFLISSLAEDGTFTKSGSTKKQIQLNFDATGQLVEESSNKTGKRDLVLWGQFDPEYFELLKFNNGTAQVKLGSQWEASISTQELQKIELVQTEFEGGAIEVWIPKAANVSIPSKLTACP